MQILAVVLYVALLLYMILLVARLVIEWIQAFSHERQPQGLVAVVFEVVFTLTDPPVEGLRKAIPPLRLGAVALDLSLMLLLLVGWILLRVLASFAA